MKCCIDSYKKKSCLIITYMLLLICGGDCVESPYLMGMHKTHHKDRDCTQTGINGESEVLEHRTHTGPSLATGALRAITQQVQAGRDLLCCLVDQSGFDQTSGLALHQYSQSKPLRKENTFTGLGGDWLYMKALSQCLTFEMYTSSCNPSQIIHC